MRHRLAVAASAAALCLPIAGIGAPGDAQAAVAGQAAHSRVAAPPYNATVGQEIAATAEQIASGGYPWTGGCKSGSGCVPYSWAAGHGMTPGPSQGRCQDGWTRPSPAPSDLYDGPACYHNGNKNGAPNGRFGVDDAGFTRWAYDLAYGTDVLGAGPARSQPLRHDMVRVPAADREPGDLLFYAAHIGIYIGNSKGLPTMIDEPQAYTLKNGTSGRSLSDWLVAYARRDTLSSYAAGKASYYRYTGNPAGLTVTANGVGEGAVLGRDGRVWLAGPPGLYNRTSSVEAFNPATRSARVYKVTSKFTIGYPPAFDIRGDVWVGSNGIDYPDDIARFDPYTGTSTTFKLPSKCDGLGSADNFPGTSAMATASDGFVWVECSDQNGDTLVIRVSSSGGMSSPFNPPSDATELGPLTPGADGSMWAIGFNGGLADGAVRILPGGQETYFPETLGMTPIALAGNGTGELIEQGECPGPASGDCYEAVGTDGTRTMIVDATGALANSFQDDPGMDRAGNVWVMASLVSRAWGYYEVTPSGRTAFHPFKMPSSLAYANPDNPPVVTADGALWTEMGQPGGIIHSPTTLLRIFP